MTDDFIRFENVSYSYTSDADNIKYAIENADLTIKKGEFTAIAGRNGSGKSTLAKLMNALLIPTYGKVYVNGKDTSDESEVWDIRRTVGMVFQNPDSQIVGATVEDDIAFGLENIGLSRDEMHERIDRALLTVRLEKERSTQPHLLSGGQKQRCAIAGITAMRPECIVFDEATAMLDPSGRREVMELAHRLNKENGITIVDITHHMEEVCCADRVILIESGKIIADTAPSELFRNRRLVEEAGLELPKAAELAEVLRDKGVPVRGTVLTGDECFEALSELLSDLHFTGESFA